MATYPPFQQQPITSAPSDFTLFSHYSWDPFQAPIHDDDNFVGYAPHQTYAQNFNEPYTFSAENVDQQNDLTARMKKDVQHQAAFLNSTLAVAPFPEARDTNMKRWIALAINEGSLLQTSDDLRHFVFEFGVTSPLTKYEQMVSNGHLRFRWTLRGAGEIKGLCY